MLGLAKETIAQQDREISLLSGSVATYQVKTEGYLQQIGGYEAREQIYQGKIEEVDNTIAKLRVGNKILSISIGVAFVAGLLIR